MFQFHAALALWSYSYVMREKMHFITSSAIITIILYYYNYYLSILPFLTGDTTGGEGGVPAFVSLYNNNDDESIVLNVSFSCIVNIYTSLQLSFVPSPIY